MDLQTDSPTFDNTYTSIFGETGIEQFKACIRHHLVSFQGRDPLMAGNQDVYRALSYALRDMLMEKWINTQKTVYAQNKKRVYYLSLEFLVGRSPGMVFCMILASSIKPLSMVTSLKNQIAGCASAPPGFMNVSRLCIQFIFTYGLAVAPTQRVITDHSG